MVRIQLNQANYTRGLDDIANTTEQNAVTVQGNLYVIIAQGDVIKVAAAVTPTGGGAATTPTAYTKDRDNNDLTTDIDKVIILANLPDGVLPTDVTDATSVAALKTTLNKGLAVAETDYLNGKIWVQGEAAVSNWTANGTTGIQEANVTVDLAPVLSRVDATVNMTAATGVYTSVADLQAAISSGSALVVEGVALIYSAHESTMVSPFTPTTPAGTVLLSGLTPEVGSSWAASNAKGKANLFQTGSDSFLKATWLGTSAWGTPANPNATGNNTTGNSTTKAGTFTRSFYAFSPKNYDAASNPGNTNISDEDGYKAVPILVVYGSRYTAAGVRTTPIYFSFRFDATDMTAGAGLGSAAPEMTPGVRYGINLTFDGDFSTKGSVDPEKPVNYGASLTVTINPAKWSAFVNLNKEFN